jgi:hypothetical protein
MAGQYQYIKSFEACGLKLNDRMGGGMLPGLHEDACRKVKQFFDDAVRSDEHKKGGIYEREWALTDKPTGKKYPQRIVIDRFDRNAYLSWKKKENLPNLLSDFGDFLFFCGGASQIGMNMRSISPVIRTASPRPHGQFSRWIMDGYYIMHYDTLAVWNDRDGTFDIREQTMAQQCKDMEDLESLQLETDRKIPYQRIKVLNRADEKDCGLNR